GRYYIRHYEVTRVFLLNNSLCLQPPRWRVAVCFGEVCRPHGYRPHAGSPEEERKEIIDRSVEGEASQRPLPLPGLIL
ncbi:hypothetical protein GOODEAATRI_030838, partial [Goodea atripinnis]